MKKLSVILVSAALIAPPTLLSGTAAAPFDENDFDSFMSTAMDDFHGFLDEANREFIDFMRSPWKKFDAEKPVEKRAVPEPEVQPQAAPDAVPDPEPHALTIEEIIDLTSRESGRKGGTSVNVAPVGQVPVSHAPVSPAPVAQPEQKPEQKPAAPTAPAAPTSPTGQTRPTSPPRPSTPAAPAAPTPAAPATPAAPKKEAPVIEAPQPKKDGMPLSFAGVTYYVSDALKGVVGSVPLNEGGVADAYEALLRSDWQPLVKDLKELRAKGLNNDWALYLFVKDVAEKLASGNGAKVLRQFLLNQLGFRARVAIVPSEKRLALYFAPDVQLYGVIFVDVDGVRYYDGDATSPYAFYMCAKEAPAAKAKIDMDVAAHPAMKGTSRTTTHTGSGRSAGITVTASVPDQLAKYYARVPQCDYSVYTGAAVNPTFAQAVVAPLRSAVQGKSETEAAAILLDYVQHAFDYATDGQQFGYEKPFFVEELFYYPQCDCEDRSVFYRFLVKEILGLDAVLLEYPNHIATAVRFSNPPGGDYVSIGGKAYTVCDPTYIGAGLGMAMPQFKNTAAKVVKL
ncbi:MAG: hypothetical protein NC418_00895 [Muribaculaceae bacterium]|nr:hypothetical protein [Muribaculaceae bacterium]